MIKKDEDNNEEPIKTVVVKSVKASAKRQLKVKWSKVSDVSGYQMQYALDKKFVKDSHTKNTKATSVTIKKLKSERKYFIRVRCYKQSEGKKIYGEWSKPKSCMTK